MNLLARLAALEARRPDAPTPLTDAQREKVALRLLRIYADEGREGLVRRLSPGVGIRRAEQAADWAESVRRRLEAG